MQAEVLADQGCVAEALPMLQTANDLWREIRDRFGLNIGLSITAKAVMASGDDKCAKAICLEGLRLQHELKNPRDVAIWLEILSEVAGKKGNWERAIRFLGAATALRETINSRLSAREAETHQMSVTKMRTEVSEGLFDSAWFGGQAMTLDESLSYAQEEFLL